MISLAFAIVVTTICEIDGTILTRIFTNNQDVIKNDILTSTLCRPKGKPICIIFWIYFEKQISSL